MMESELIALDKCGEEAEWLHQFLENLPRWPKLVPAISLHCDSYKILCIMESLDTFVVDTIPLDN